MKVILKLDKQEDILELNRLMKADEMASFIWDFKQILHDYAESESRISPKKICKEFCDQLFNKGINIDELWG